MTTHDRNLRRFTEASPEVAPWRVEMAAADAATDRVMSTELGRATAAMSADDCDLQAVTYALFGRDI